MKIAFAKYQGTGNDFILFDNRDGKLPDFSTAWLRAICDRRFGIGADGVMILLSHPSLDYEMRYYNSDGNESSMCGNGGRCMVNFVRRLGTNKQTFHFQAIDGPHTAYVKGDTIELQMKDVELISKHGNDFILDTGSPHYVMLTSSVNEIDVRAKGSAIRYAGEFEPGGINVNFVEQSGNTILIRTYERGVEDETLSCGTGVTAAALVVASRTLPNGTHTLRLTTMGGQLSVRFDKISESVYHHVFLIGPGEFVFDGVIDHPGN